MSDDKVSVTIPGQRSYILTFEQLEKALLEAVKEYDQAHRLERSPEQNNSPVNHLAA
jgi:hypothetical protein